VHLTVQARFGAGASKKGLKRYLVGVLCYKNLVEAVALTLARCRAEIRKNAQSTVQQKETEMSKPLLENTEFMCVENWKPAPDLCAERAPMTRRAERHDRYQQVIELRTQGLGSTEIAQRVGLSARTIQHWLKEETFPEARRRRKRQSNFDPYADYVLSGWEEGEHNGLTLWHEIKDQLYLERGATNEFYDPWRPNWVPALPLF
jgi:predicted DNA-binding transcriptional regulator AlpA